jgi:hypothetical protein
MSALGHSRPMRSSHTSMYVRFCPKADKRADALGRRLVPIATEGSAAKSVFIRYFVGAGRQRRHVTAAVADDTAARMTHSVRTARFTAGRPARREVNRPSGPRLAGRLRAPNENPAQGMGIRAPTERGSEIPRGTLGWGCRRYARGRLQRYALHRHAASTGFAVTFRQPSAGNVRASGAASTLQRSRGIPHTRHPSRCTSTPPDPTLRSGTNLMPGGYEC